MNIEHSFAGLGLADPLLRAIADAGYRTPTPIQSQAIPLVLAGGDLLAAAQTGTGKTAGFTLPILHRLAAAGARKAGRPRCLILTPTRELAAQVKESVDTYGRFLPVASMVMFGGVGLQPQVNALRKPVDILVATPGRLLDHAGQRNVDLSGVEILVLDEADRMLDMGFIRDIRKILALLPRKRQNLLFSATFSDEIRQLADGLLHEPGYVEVARRNTTTELVEQQVHLVAQKHKRHLLSHLIKTRQWFQVLVFTRTKHGANRLAEQLGKDGIGAAAIHGNKSQGARTRALADFKSAKLQVLVATDIAARGLDIDQLPQVVNFELPNVPEDYVHRIGRTGRAGAKGAAVSLVDREEMKHLAAIERLTRQKIARVEAEDFVAPVGVPAESAREVRPPRPAREGQARRTPQRPHKPRKAEAGAPRHAERPRGDGRARGSAEPRSAEAAGKQTPPRRAKGRQRAALFAPRPQGSR
ncbi:MAG: DEAD/DEAH box helicase [Rhodocyclaceae bacterium]|nr:DEAD/DEAH box helicase [Rhodocyclaceae bacterium]